MGQFTHGMGHMGQGNFAFVEFWMNQIQDVSSLHEMGNFRVSRRYKIDL